MPTPSGLDQTYIDLLSPASRISHLYDGIHPHTNFVPNDTDGNRKSSFDFISTSLETCQYSRALSSIPGFIIRYKCLTPDELATIRVVLEERNDEQHEIRSKLQDLHILIEFDSMILQRTKLSDDSRSETIARLMGTKAQLACEEKNSADVNRGYGIVGAILLDQEYVPTLPFFTENSCQSLTLPQSYMYYHLNCTFSYQDSCFGSGQTISGFSISRPINV